MVQARSLPPADRNAVVNECGKLNKLKQHCKDESDRKVSFCTESMMHVG